MKIFNTLTRKIEEFEPIQDKKVGIYSCGPTVYDVAHIGNLRTYIFNDILKRVLRYFGYSVDQVMNVTDVDDKTIKGSEGKKAKLDELTRKYEKKFFDDLKDLNILMPEKTTRATEYVDKMVLFVEDLMEKGYAYKAGDNSIYFSIAKFKDYGKLSKLDKEGIKAGARVAQDEYDKENPSDFVLWKAWDEADGEIYWETSIGKGRPGWHLECSTMSGDLLGETIDIHTGAVDLVFPHHENEIAQSEARNGKRFVNFWVHGEHLLVDGKKMSKSLGNVYNLEDMANKGFSPLDFRYLVLGSHYRSKLNFTWAALEGAKNTRERLDRIILLLRGKVEGTALSEAYLVRFKDAIGKDLDIPVGLSVLWEMLRDEKVNESEKYNTALAMDEVLGLKLSSIDEEKAPEDVIKLAEDRLRAKKDKDYAKADQLREQIETKGYKVEDTGDTYKLIKQHGSHTQIDTD